MRTTGTYLAYGERPHLYVSYPSPESASGRVPAEIGGKTGGKINAPHVRKSATALHSVLHQSRPPQISSADLPVLPSTS